MADKKPLVQEIKYTKEQFLLYYPLREKRDILAALLKSGREYTIREVDEIIYNFEKGKVN